MLKMLCTWEGKDLFTFQVAHRIIFRKPQLVEKLQDRLFFFVSVHRKTTFEFCQRAFL